MAKAKALINEQEEDGQSRERFRSFEEETKNTGKD
jgi:hypothetical protein